MPDVFISYKSTERAQVAPIARGLEAAGYTVWWDPQLEVSSHPYPRQISEAMANAKAVIVCWSPAALASDWVIAEASAAREAGKLIQLKIASCVLPPPFNVLEAADLSSWRSGDEHADWNRVLQSVARHTSQPPRPPEQARRTSVWRKIRVPAAAIAAVLSVSLLTFQNLSAICDATGWFCKAEPGEASPAPLPSDDHQLAATPTSPPASCGNDRLRPIIENMTHTLDRASVGLCKDGRCDLASVPISRDDTDIVEFSISSEASGALYMVDVDASGAETQLLPNNRGFGDPRIQAGEVRRFPFVATEPERGCVLVFIAPSNSAFARVVERPEVITRGFEPAPHTTEEIRDPIAIARRNDPNMAGWAFAWMAYEVRERE